MRFIVDPGCGHLFPSGLVWIAVVWSLVCGKPDLWDRGLVTVLRSFPAEQSMCRKILRLETCERSQNQKSWPEEACRSRNGEGGQQNQLLHRKEQADDAKASCRDTHEAAASQEAS